MPHFSHTLGQRRYVFDELTSLLAKASPLKSGDQLAGIAAASSPASRSRTGATTYPYWCKRLIRTDEFALTSASVPSWKTRTHSFASQQTFAEGKFCTILIMRLPFLDPIGEAA